MNKNEIMNMPAGVTLDWHIAHFVMGLPSKELSDDCPCAYCGSQMRYCGARSWCSECREWRHSAYKEYSDDLVSAWEIIEKLENGQPETLCNISRISENGQRDGLEWHCHLRCIDGKSTYYYAIADTVSLAICRAALLARGLTSGAVDGGEGAGLQASSTPEQNPAPEVLSQPTHHH